MSDEVNWEQGSIIQNYYGSNEEEITGKYEIFFPKPPFDWSFFVLYIIIQKTMDGKKFENDSPS